MAAKPPKVTPKEAELLVYGYTRILSEHWGLRTPKSIQSLCLYMYSFMDTWNINVDDKLKEGLKFNSEHNILTLIDNNTGNWLNAFGSHIIGKGMRKIWRFRICEKTISSMAMLNAAIMIGIIDETLIHRKERFSGNFTDEIGGYGFYSSDGGRYGKLSQYQGRSYGNKWTHGSIITMQLDMTGSGIGDDCYATLEYWINGKHQGLAFYEIDLEKEYCLAVALLYSNEGIQLLPSPDIGEL